jgi:hypothetical protein
MRIKYQPMRLSLAMIALLLSGCRQVPNTFEVQAPDADAAELQLCKQRTALKQSGSWFATIQPIGCEGEGKIAVRLTDKSIVSCHIGYVTPGAVQRFRFKIEGRECRPSDA